MRTFVGFLLFASALVIQTSLLAHLRILQGTADLVLLTLLVWLMQPQLPRPRLWELFVGLLAGWVSALPWPVAVVAYAAAGELTLALRRRLWQTSVLLYLFLVVSGTVIVQGISWAALQAQGIAIPWQMAVAQVMLPSAVLNFLLALPVHSLITEIAAWVFPHAEESA